MTGDVTGDVTGKVKEALSMILELVFLCLDVDIGNLTKHVWDIVSLVLLP